MEMILNRTRVKGEKKKRAIQKETPVPLGGLRRFRWGLIPGGNVTKFVHGLEVNCVRARGLLMKSSYPVSFFLF